MVSKAVHIGIYAGTGTSHSWLWFVDLFEKAGFLNLSFLDEKSVKNNHIKPLDVLVLSGGDTFAVAEGLGPDGAKHIRAFVRSGGLYIGSCAGAYLPMKSSKKPLDLFNFVDVKITNLSRILPEAEIKSNKFCTAYGCDYIFHPVREAVVLKTTAHFTLEPDVEFEAPLYGGPGMTVADPSWILAHYSGFSNMTMFLTQKQIAEDTLINRAAVVRVPFGLGAFYLLGPHLEHPGYETANRFIIDAIAAEKSDCAGQDATKKSGPSKSCETCSDDQGRALLLSIKRELSNSRIVAAGMEFLPVHWLIGQKVYEPQKIRVYLESMWKRIRPLEKSGVLNFETGQAEALSNKGKELTRELRELKSLVDKNGDSLKTARNVFELLHLFAIGFFDLYFSTAAQSKRS